MKKTLRWCDRRDRQIFYIDADGDGFGSEEIEACDLRIGLSLLLEIVMMPILHCSGADEIVMKSTNLL